MHTPAEVRAVFSGSPKSKAELLAKIGQVNAKFQLDLPQKGTMSTLKAALKSVKAELMSQVCKCSTGRLQFVVVCVSLHTTLVVVYTY